MVQKRSANPPRTADVFDELLVLLAQTGDRQAFARLHQRWHPRLIRAAARYTADPDSASDLAQDCWLGIWKGLAGLREPSRFRSYAFGVLHRRGADHLRKAIRTRSHEALVPIPEIASDTGQTPAHDDRESITQAFAQLPPDQRLAAHLHFVEGFTLAEIAKVQSIPLGTAKSRLFHARRTLKAALTEQPEGEHP
ncbi:MAG: RNA polymerase sigma factor [Pseudomonadota bacterium]